MDFKDLKHNVGEKIIERELIRKDLNELDKKLSLIRKDLKRTIDAQKIIQQVAIITQEKLIFEINEIVNTIMNYVFPECYEFKIEFVTKRGKTECNFLLIKDGRIYDVMTENGGGVVDVIAFSIRIAIFNLKRNKIMNTIILDEPFKFLDRTLKVKAGEIIKTLSDKLNIQFIIVSHDDSIIDVADSVFSVSKNSEISVES